MKRYELINKYNPNELIQDNYYQIDNTPQVYDAECIEYELNDYYKRLKNIYELCQKEQDKTKTIKHIMSIIEESTDELNEYKIWGLK